MSKIYDLNAKQIELKNKLFYLDKSDEEDAELIEEINYELSHLKGSAENTLVFLYGILNESKAEAAARSAVVDYIKKNDLLRAQRREKVAESAVERLNATIIRIIETFDINDCNLPDGSTINKKLNPGKLIINEAALDLDVLPESLTRTIPEHLELADDAKAKIMATLRDQIKDAKGRMNQVDSFVTLDEFPGFALVRDVVIQVK
jgi:hypothetical protein